jgi:NitT/TauT family transport system ATP-binding protein
VVASTASDYAVRGSTLTLREVSHRFDLEGRPLPVLDRISLQVGRGEFVALLGPSGCGKSTLLRLVAGLDTPTAGSLLTEGREIEAPDPSRVVVFQDPTLYPWRTVWSNVALGLEARGLLRTHRGRIEDALRLVGLTGFANAYPHQLSGGMAQRAALARALVNDPKLLILDEPLGQLDSLTRITMQGELVSLWQRAGFTALLVTHDVEEALFLAGRVIVLSQRPAHIKAEIANARLYPRHRGDPHLAELRHQVLAHLGLDATWYGSGKLGHWRHFGVGSSSSGASSRPARRPSFLVCVILPLLQRSVYRARPEVVGAHRRNGAFDPKATLA